VLEGEFNHIIGRNMKDCRRDKGIQQRDLANKLSLKRTSVTNMERGNQKLSLYNLYCIACEMGVYPEELLVDFQHFKAQYQQSNEEAVNASMEIEDLKQGLTSVR
jgi:transcriptional regulator with XRE-family HTH domain